MKISFYRQHTVVPQSPRLAFLDFFLFPPSFFPALLFSAVQYRSRTVFPFFLFLRVPPFFPPFPAFIGRRTNPRLPPPCGGVPRCACACIYMHVCVSLSLFLALFLSLHVCVCGRYFIKIFSIALQYRRNHTNHTSPSQDKPTMINPRIESDDLRLRGHLKLALVFSRTTSDRQEKKKKERQTREKNIPHAYN